MGGVPARAEAKRESARRSAALAEPLDAGVALRAFAPGLAVALAKAALAQVAVAAAGVFEALHTMGLRAIPEARIDLLAITGVRAGDTLRLEIAPARGEPQRRQDEAAEERPNRARLHRVPRGEEVWRTPVAIGISMPQHGRSDRRRHAPYTGTLQRSSRKNEIPTCPVAPTDKVRPLLSSLSRGEGACASPPSGPRGGQN